MPQGVSIQGRPKSPSPAQPDSAGQVWSARAIGLLALLMTAAAALLLFRLDYPSPWADEIFTVNYIRHDFGYLLSFDRPLERHPPGYYVVLKAWTEIFGDGRVAVRGFSVAFAVACLPLLYGIARERLEFRTALLAAFFLALFPGLVHYGREARMYAQLFFFLLLASYLFIRLFTRFSGMAPFGRMTLTAGFALALAGTFYTHYTAALYYACFTVAAFAMAWRNRAWTWLGYMAAGMTLATLLALPQIFHMLKFVAPAAEEWIPATNFEVVRSNLNRSFPNPEWVKPLLLVLYLLGLLRLWCRDRDLFFFVLSFLGLGTLLLAVIGIVRPMFLAQTWLPFALLTPILLALVAAQLPRPAWLAVGIFVTGASVAANIRDYPEAREALFAETASPILAAVDPDRDRVFYIASQGSWTLSGAFGQFDMLRIDHRGFTPVTYEQVDEDSRAVSAHLSKCAETDACGRTLLILDPDPWVKAYEEPGARWLDFAESLGPDTTTPIEDFVIYEFD